MAQLVAHLHGMQGVRGSSPLRSTTSTGTPRIIAGRFSFVEPYRTGFSAGLVALLVVYAVAGKLWIQDLFAPVARGLWWLIARGSAVVAMAVFVSVFVVIGPALSLGT